MTIKLKYHFSTDKKPCFINFPHLTTNTIERLALNPNKILPHLNDKSAITKKNVFFEEIVFDDREKSSFF